MTPHPPTRPLLPVLLLPLTLLACGGDAPRADTGDPTETAPTPAHAVAPDDVPPGVWDEEPALRWSLEEEARIGRVEGDPAYVFGYVRNVIPADGGGVWIFDGQAYELRRFDAEGTHVLSVGRKGRGPGEFWGNACGRRGADGEIWVETETDWHRFGPGGALLGTFRTPSTMACGPRAWMPDGRYVVANVEFDPGARVPRVYYVVLEWADGAMTPLDTVEGPEVPTPETVTFESGRSRSVQSIPFQHPPGPHLEDGGRFWVWDGGGAYEIRLESLRGEVLRTASRPYAPIPIDADVRRQAIADVRRPGWRAVEDFDPSRVPRVYPPFARARLAEDGSIWVRRVVGHDERVWEVFSEDDRYLGVLDVPEGLEGMSLRHIGADHVWGVVRDDLGLQYVVRARIVKPGGGEEGPRERERR